MLAVNYTELRGNMKECMDKVSDDYETIIVTRKKNKNIVMMSEEAYNNMMENMHLMGNQTNYNWLMESKKQLEEGCCHVKELIEVSADEYLQKMDGMIIFTGKRKTGKHSKKLIS